MSTYTPAKPRCCKCGKGPASIVTKWEPGIQWPEENNRLECLRHTCECGYSWTTPTVDAKGK